jgi:hypothetical protein
MSDHGASTRVAPDRGLEVVSAALMALATHPFTHSRTPASPFGMAAYPSTGGAAAEAPLKLADQRVEAAEVENQHSDDYVLLTVLAARVLLFSGMGVKFEGRWIKIALPAFGALLFVGAAVVAAIFPMTGVNMG